MGYEAERATSFNQLTVKIGDVTRLIFFKSGGDITVAYNQVATPSGAYQTGIGDATDCSGVAEMDYELCQQICDWINQNSTNNGTLQLGSAIHTSVNSENAGVDSTGNKRGKIETYFNSCVVKEVPKTTRSESGAKGELNFSFSLAGYDKAEATPL